MRDKKVYLRKEKRRNRHCVGSVGALKDRIAKTNDENGCHVATKKLEDEYKQVERRKLLENEFCGTSSEEELGGIHGESVRLKSEPAPPRDFCVELDENDRAICRLPEDGGIFYEGIPFHHYSLTPLTDVHFRRLLANGIEIDNRQFSKKEDIRLLKNWRAYAEEFDVPDEEAPYYMSAATKKEDPAAWRARLRQMRETNFRPAMCKLLLNRTCVQVFRRCYHLFREDRGWKKQEDAELMAMVKKRGHHWEKISRRLRRTRFACSRRYHELLKKKDADGSTDEEYENDDAEEGVQRKRRRPQSSRLIVPMELSAMQMADAIDALLEHQSAYQDRRKFTSFQRIVNAEELNKKLYKTLSIHNKELKDVVLRRVLRRLRYILVTCRFYHFFHALPHQHDTLAVRLEMLGSLFRKKNRFTIRKRKIVAHVRRAIRARGWTPQERIVFVSTTNGMGRNTKADDEEMGEDEEDYEQVSEKSDQQMPMEEEDDDEDEEEAGSGNEE